MTISITDIKTAALVVFFNANTGLAPITKFADRTTAERRVSKLIEELSAEGFSDEIITQALNLGKPVEEVKDAIENPVGAKIIPNAVEDSDADESATVDEPVIDNFSHCPCCGIHLHNGYTTYTDLEGDRESHNVDLSDMTHEYMCLGCGGYFGPELSKKEQGSRKLRGKVPAIAESMRLDRRTLCLETGEEWSNAGKIWTTHGTAWMKASQHDKMTKELYTAAKKGQKITHVVECADGVTRSFQLVAI
jgi:hypothetical protein